MDSTTLNNIRKLIALLERLIAGVAEEYTSEIDIGCLLEEVQAELEVLKRCEQEASNIPPGQVNWPPLLAALKETLQWLRLLLTITSGE